jgi:RNA polymerase sigma-70 factor (ECF subfamily)
MDHRPRLRGRRVSSGRRGRSAAGSGGITAGAAVSPEAIYATYGTRVYSVARRMTGTDADAEDVTREVLLQVVSKMVTLGGDAPRATWLHRVTVGAVLVHRRERATVAGRRLVVDGGEADNAASGRREMPSGAAVVDGGWRGRFEAAIGALATADRDPFILSDVERIPAAEVADLLGLTVRAVERRVHRARLMLRDALQDMG